MPTTAEQNYRKRQNRKAKRNEELRSRYPSVEDWIVIEEDSLQCLCGKIHNDQRFTNGSEIITSPLITIDHLIATTRSGKKYVLGKPSIQYLHHRQDHGLGGISTKKYFLNQY